MSLEDVKNLVKEVSPVIPLPEKGYEGKTKETKELIDAKKAELELAKIEAELKKINSPSGNNDYLQQILALQNAHNAQMMAMMKEAYDMKAEILKVKLEHGSDNEMMQWMDFLEPIIEKYAPMLFAGLTGNKKPQTEDTYVLDASGKYVLNPRIYKPDGTLIQSQNTEPNNLQGSTASAQNPEGASAPSAQIPEDYKMDIEKEIQLIREGKTSLEEAWQKFQVAKAGISGFQRKVADAMDFETFKKRYDDIKSGRA